MRLRSSSHAFTKLIQTRHTHVEWPHLHLKIDEPVEEFKKTRDGTYGTFYHNLLLLLILYDPKFACHSDNFMSLVYITMDTLVSMVIKLACIILFVTSRTYFIELEE